MKKLRKGFTIVELVIVIAVIAVLAAVLIPTFVHLSKKAKTVSDQSLVANLNTALKIEEAESSKKPETMHGALLGLQHQGYIVENLVTRSDEELVYSLEENKFYLSNSVTQGYNYWHIYHNPSQVPSTQTWSIYAGGGDWTSFTNLNVGFDAGNVETSQLNYVNKTGVSKNVLIRTNGGTFTVDAPNDTVRHFDTAEKVSIEAVKGNSYHENGSVLFTEISKGRIVLEKTSEVNHIHINKKTADSFDTITIAKDESVEMPTLSRDDVNIASTGTLVVALQEGTEESADKDYVWLTKQGIYEQVTISDNASSSTSSTGVVWADDESVSETNQNAAQQIANNFVSETVRPEWSADDDDRDLANITNVKEIATAVAMEEYGEEWEDLSSEEQAALVDEQKAVVTDPSKAIEEVADKESVQTGALLFAGGTGSDKDPFLIKNAEQWNNIYYGDETYKLISDIDFEGTAPLATASNYIKVIGDNHKIVNANGPIFKQNWIYDMHLENITFVNCESNFALICNYGSYNVLSKQEFINIDAQNCTAKGGSLFLPWVYDQYSVLFKDCDIIGCTINDDIGAQGFVGAFTGNSKASVRIENCTLQAALSSKTYAMGGFTGSTNGSLINCSMLPGTTLTQKANKDVNVMGGSSRSNCICYATVFAQEESLVKKNGFNDTVVWSSTELGFTASDFIINNDGSIDYIGSVEIAKIKISQYFTLDRLHDGKYENGGFPTPLDNGKVFTNISSGKIENALDYVTEVKNVTNMYGDILNCVVEELPEGLSFNEFGFAFNNGKLYLNANQAEGDYSSNFFSGTLKAKSSNKISVTVTFQAFDADDNVLGTVSNSYTISLSK